MGGQAKKKSKAKRKENRGGASGHTLMSPQERMKAKMQEKAKKKTAEKYTVDQLLEKTEESMDNFDFPMAKMFCQRALDMEPTNLSVLNMLGNICAELGDVDKAKQVFLKAVELSPEEGHSNYMYLGQIHAGMEAVQYFSKGIKVMLNAIDKQAQEAGDMGAAAMPSEPSISAKDVSVAFCSIAEIFFTDLCMEEGAAEKCKEAIEKALHYDQHNPEALQLMASYLFSIDNTEEGRDYLIKSVSSWLPSLQKEEESSACVEQPEDEEPQNSIPPYESRITTAKLLIEAEEFELCNERDVIICLLLSCTGACVFVCGCVFFLSLCIDCCLVLICSSNWNSPHFLRVIQYLTACHWNALKCFFLQKLSVIFQSLEGAGIRSPALLFSACFPPQGILGHIIQHQLNYC
ncbi:putative assembly chaperone of rpl4 [Astyanax mexicanus]|uniref:Putative assembly chaperone of rpl4 n=1 Tax=Astyanax mexicanus TaxID=7994 RepID=A0A8T2MSQ4_ASTMX|nr:putative assembly chaperone of rpl4 [Astyanax mexicanus]